jgi:ribonuclease E
MAQQDQVNADVQAISDGLTSVAQEISDLKTQLASQVPANVDLSGLDALVQRVKDLAPQSAPAAPADAPAPVDAAPAPDASAPAPADGSAPTA